MELNVLPYSKNKLKDILGVVIGLFHSALLFQRTHERFCVWWKLLRCQRTRHSFPHERALIGGEFCVGQRNEYCKSLDALKNARKKSVAILFVRTSFKSNICNSLSHN